MGRSVDGKGIPGGCEVAVVRIGVFGLALLIGRDSTVVGNSMLDELGDLGLTPGLWTRRGEVPCLRFDNYSSVCCR